MESEDDVVRYCYEYTNNANDEMGYYSKSPLCNKENKVNNILFNKYQEEFARMRNMNMNNNMNITANLNDNFNKEKNQLQSKNIKETDLNPNFICNNYIPTLPIPENSFMENSINTQNSINKQQINRNPNRNSESSINKQNFNIMPSQKQSLYKESKIIELETKLLSLNKDNNQVRYNIQIILAYVRIIKNV